MPGQAVEIHHFEMLERQAQVMARTHLVPDYFHNKPDDLIVAALGLEANGAEFNVNTVNQVYVVNGSPGYMAQIQIAFGAMHGVEIVPVNGRCDAKSAEVRLRLPGSTEWHTVVYTMATAELTPEYMSNPLYKKRPEAMLVARAVTTAVHRHCPWVLMGIKSNIEYLSDGGVAPPVSDGGTEPAEPYVDGVPSGPAAPDPPQGPQQPAMVDTADATAVVPVLDAIGKLNDKQREQLKARWPVGVRHLNHPKFDQSDARRVLTEIGLINATPTVAG